MKRPIRLILILLILAGIGGGGYWWWIDRNTVDPLADIITAEAVAGDIETAVLASGTLRPATMVAVGAQVSGRVTALRVNLGQQLRKGDLVAEIDSLPQQNALKTAEASLSAVKAQLQERQATLSYAKAALVREGMTLRRNATSRDAYESAETTVKATEAQIAALNAQIIEAEVAVETARINLGYTRITAPIDGTVLLIVTQEGQTVNASQSAPTIIIMGQVETMTVRAEISEADATRVHPGQAVYFTILGDSEKRWEATLEAVDPAPDDLRYDSEISSLSSSAASSSSSSTSTAIYYFGRFTVPNPDGLLKTYMTAEVHIVLGAAKNAVMIPTSALSEPGPKGERYVDVVGADGTITSRQVETGLDDKVKVEIRSGLKLGEKVVSSRKSGTFVKTRPAGPMGM